MQQQLLAATVVAGLAFAAVPAQAASIDTTPFWNGSNFIQTFGKPGAATYGETFIAPAATLKDFTFYLDPFGHSLTLRAQVYAWSGPLRGNGGGATGPALFTGPSTTITAPPGTVGDPGFQAVTTHPGNLALTVGQAYVALLTISFPADFAATTGGSAWGSMVFGTHPGVAGDGGFVYFNNGNDPSLLNTSAWSTFADFGSLAWKANFAAAPEPASMALLGAGLLGLGLVRRRR